MWHSPTPCLLWGGGELTSPASGEVGRSFPKRDLLIIPADCRESVFTFGPILPFLAPHFPVQRLC